MKLRTKIGFGLVAALGLFSSCETTELEGLLDNPNQLRPEQINLASGIDGLQFQMNNVFRSTSAVAADATRLSWMFGTTYQNAFSPGSGGGAWNAAYAGILLDSNVIIPQLVELDAAYEEGMVRTIKAYALMTLVDFWGDVPFDEAALGLENFNPALTPGDQVYAAALAELDLAIAAFDRDLDPDITTGSIVGGDIPLNLFFAGDDIGSQTNKSENWKKFATTLQFKYHLNLGNVTELNALIASGDLIEDIEDSVALQYGTSTNPESRNPVYVAEYGDDTPGDYISNSLMYRMVDINDQYFGEDPRAAHYFYRQTTEFPTGITNPSIGDALPCFDDPSPYAPEFVFCAFDLTDDNPAAYWGRDHGDSGGIPPDNNLRSTYGSYPIGGNVDTGDGGGVGDGDGINGEGISPLLMAWQVDMMRAEAALRLGTADLAANVLLQRAIEKSVSFVTAFDRDLATDDNGVAFASNVIADFDAAGSVDDQLQILGTQFWISCYQSGNEFYNFYRRTGFPNNLQPHLQLGGAGDFPRSLFYVGGTANLNLSVQQKPDLNQSVFWADSSIPLN
ncbi:SusD/RagB family nutrient-binding outer membrane lipoprotein [uncultured Dokdonia sp.]|uniref:SusD/RagB family nutrient-binding outer membrane lipoprotein n=1 Tax=unclassified Dokdonia TaxID=2615033 RepID=UPI00262146D5|nr:SusD/RagB family nutrient-binding outer membrane lipoprotein [uncultured Dokdonia sp.]